MAFLAGRLRAAMLDFASLGVSRRAMSGRSAGWVGYVLSLCVAIIIVVIVIVIVIVVILEKVDSG